MILIFQPIYKGAFESFYLYIRKSCTSASLRSYFNLFGEKLIFVDLKSKHLVFVGSDTKWHNPHGELQLFGWKVESRLNCFPEKVFSSYSLNCTWEWFQLSSRSGTCLYVIYTNLNIIIIMVVLVEKLDCHLRLMNWCHVYNLADMSLIDH